MPADNINEYTIESADPSATDSLVDDVYDAAADPGATATDSAVDPATQGEIDSATNLQAEATDAINQGDYATAADDRAQAETAAGQAGDTDMLTGADSIALQSAADEQQTAQQDETQEGQDAAAGNYAAAQNDATQAEGTIQDADDNAGGTDHSGTAYDEAQNESWANWDQQTADQNAQTAASYDAAGMTDDGDIYAAAADNEQANADEFGELGQDGDALAQTDPSSEIATENSDGAFATADDALTTSDDTLSATDDTLPLDDSAADTVTTDDDSSAIS